MYLLRDFMRACVCVCVQVKVGGIKGCQILTAQPPVHSVSPPLSLCLSLSRFLSVRQKSAAREQQLDKLSNCSQSPKIYNVEKSQRTRIIAYPLSAEHFGWQNYSHLFYADLMLCWCHVEKRKKHIFSRGGMNCSTFMHLLEELR